MMRQMLYLKPSMESESLIYTQKKSEWLKNHKDQWVWIRGQKFDFYPSYEAAVEAAYAQGYSDKPTFIKQVTEEDETPAIAGFYSWAV